jgi:N-acetylglucosamine kinase-like BadF-type ATPase
MMPRYYIAIDGGGTKTDATLFDDTGRVACRTIGESTNPNALSDAELKGHFTDIFMDLFKNEKPKKIVRCYAGMSGADHPILNNRIKTVITETLSVPCDDLLIENDAINALWSGTDGKPGVVVVAGTGSIAYGRHADGSSFRIGGWGHLVGDDGSGYYIGKEVVRAALRAHDGIDAPSPLFEKIKAHFNITLMPDVIPIVYGSNKTTLSKLAPMVVASAAEGDVAAVQILKDAAHFLSELIEASLARFSNQEIPVVLVGGLWHSEHIKHIATARFKQNFIMPEFPPVYGSMVGALGPEANQEILTTLKSFFR